jgi:iron(III) transport system ATP-binding protein
MYLAATGISKAFGEDTALESASALVREGESLVLLGPSGCGKTTLLRIIAGLTTPDVGAVSLAGKRLVGDGVFVPPERRQIGMVFQDLALFPHLSVAENVAFGLDRRDGAPGRVAETLALVGLEGHEHRYPATLSGGQAQRVALARALAPRPRVVLFDEPFSSLDVGLRAEVRAEVVQLLRDVGMTAIFVTHDQEEAFVLGDEMAVMQNGKVMQQGTPEAVYHNPANPWVATFVGEANLVPGVVDGTVATTALGLIPVVGAHDGGGQVVVRPEHLRLEPGDDAVVVDVDFYGHDSSLQVEMRGVEYTVRAASASSFRPGDRVGVSYSGPTATVFADALVGRSPALIY